MAAIARPSGITAAWYQLRDLRSLKTQGLIEERTVTHLRDRTVADPVSVTPSGQQLLDHHRDPNLDSGQMYYSGWVKPGELLGDARLFRIVRQVEAELEQQATESSV